MIGKITFKDLSPGLKVAAFFGWLSMAYYAIVLLIGLIVLLAG